MGGNIPGGDFLCGNFLGGSFPDTLFDNTLQKFSVELNRADYCMETSLLYYREMNLKITL